MECVLILNGLEEEAKTLSEGLIHLNGSKILNVMNECRKVQICMEPTCFPQKIKKSLAIGCETIELRNTEFSNCLFEIQQEYFVTKLNCLDSNGIYEERMRNKTHILEAEKSCVKFVMENVCGVEAIRDFDKHTAQVARISREPVTLVSMSYMQVI
uniref:DUF19 domain-containing protein n=1 Tax=Caenorhabditis tropicalis TaxID=1561998 RepID=A0A1I7V2C2_9PELO